VSAPTLPVEAPDVLLLELLPEVLDPDVPLDVVVFVDPPVPLPLPLCLVGMSVVDTMVVPPPELGVFVVLVGVVLTGLVTVGVASAPLVSSGGGA